MNKNDRLVNNKTFMNKSQLNRFMRWNGDIDNLKFYYNKSFWTVGYQDKLGFRYNCNFRWHNTTEKSYILENNNGLLIKIYATDDIEYINKRGFTYNKIVSIFNKRDGDKYKYKYY